MTSTQLLPAKVLKRMGQIGRLGPKGLARTAYIRALGPSVYSIADFARGMSIRVHRQRAQHRALATRTQTLKERTVAIEQRNARGIRQQFGADLGEFVQTLEALLDLEAAGCAVPRVLAIDWTSHTITLERFESGSMNVSVLEQVLLAIHRAGYVVGDIGREDVGVTSTGMPVILNLRRAVPLAGLSRDMSVYLRDLDRQRFNTLFETQLLTAIRLRSMLSPKARIPRDHARGTFSEVYAPVVIRDDIRWGKIWNTDLGTGRWNFIMKDHLPIPSGGSVLDLGSNNGFNPLQMLRAGAASAVGIEIDATAVEQAAFLKSAYEWLDNRQYDFRCIQGSQGDLATFNLPRFDMVTAFCSLYYLPDAEIRQLVRHIRTMTNVLVLQCNIDRLIDRGGEEETFRKASVEYAAEVLEEAGFRNRTIVAPAGYSRPLVIGRTA
jgi:SAM-dependent methyltransferase